MIKPSGNDKYDRVINSLSSYLQKEEKQRRKWAGEKWGYPGGRLDRLCKRFTYILFPFAVIFSLAYIYMIHMYYEKVENNVFPRMYGVISTALCISSVLFFVAVILYFLKKDIAAGIFAAVPAAIFAVHIFSSYFQIKPLVEDPLNFYLFISFILTIIIVYAVSVNMRYVLYIKEKKYMNKAVERTLLKISNKKNTTMISLDEYAKLIKEYVANERVKK